MHISTDNKSLKEMPKTIIGHIYILNIIFTPKTMICKRKRSMKYLKRFSV